MKKLLLFALVLSLAMGTAIARQKGGPDSPPKGGGDPIERLTDQLGLDVDQVEAITAIFEATNVLRDEQREVFQEVFCELRTEFHTQIYAELTPEQQALFDELLQEREDARAAYMETHPEHRDGGRHEMMDCDS
jgi:Spy/CpxP family protein refolding chaperone